MNKQKQVPTCWFSTLNKSWRCKVVSNLQMLSLSLWSWYFLGRDVVLKDALQSPYEDPTCIIVTFLKLNRTFFQQPQFSFACPFLKALNAFGFTSCFRSSRLSHLISCFLVLPAVALNCRCSPVEFG